MPYFPAHDHRDVPPSNAIRAQLDEEPKYPEKADERRYVVLFPEDYSGFGQDVDGNLAVLVNREQAAEMERLAREAREELEAANTQGTEAEK